MNLNVCPAANVAAPVKVVWEMAQPTNLSKWIDGQVERIEPEGPMAIGQTIYITSTAIGRRWQVTLTDEEIVHRRGAGEIVQSHGYSRASSMNYLRTCLLFDLASGSIATKLLLCTRQVKLRPSFDDFAINNAISAGSFDACGLGSCARNFWMGFSLGLRNIWCCPHCPNVAAVTCYSRHNFIPLDGLIINGKCQV